MDHSALPRAAIAAATLACFAVLLAVLGRIVRNRKLRVPVSDRAIAALRTLQEVVIDRTSTVAFQPHNFQHLIAMSLHGTILEHTKAATDSLEAGNSSAAFILTRSALEAFVDLANLVEDPTYSENMHCAFLSQQEKTSKNALGRGATNPYLAAITRDTTLPAHLASLQAELQALAAKGKRELSVRQRFKLAGLEDQYEGPYSYLCSHSHNNLSALERRHFGQGPSGPEIWYFQPPSDSDVQLVVDTLAGIVANSAANIVHLLEGQDPPKLPTVTQKLKELRALWRPGA